MRHVRTAGQALRLASEPTTQPYICRACLARSTRQFHTSARRHEDASVPLWKRMQNSLFGSKEAAKAQESRELKTKQRLEEVSKKDSGELETRTDRRGNVYQVAEIVDTSTHSGYTAASSWQGLERVGSEQWVRQRADRGEQYSGFMPTKQSQLDENQWHQLLHHITAQVAALQKAGRPILDICHAPAPLGEMWSRTLQAEITSVDGILTIRYASEGDEQAILQAIPENLDTDNGSHEIGNSFNSLIKENVHAFFSPKVRLSKIDLRNSAIKLAIVKRAMQLTGKRISDSAMSNASNLQDLYEALRTKEKPKKLAKSDELQELNEDLPNVRVHLRRQTPVHKEKAVGRWKVIEEELTLRDLPVFGTRFKDAKERLKNNGL